MPNIIFDGYTHTYYNDGKPLISVTQLLRKHGLAPDYSMVNKAVLDRKASIGTMIHKEIENYVHFKTIEEFHSAELDEFIRITKAKKLKFSKAEVIVGNDIVAGTIDLIGNGIIADNKTSNLLDIDYVTWQTSVYAYLYEREYDTPIKHLYAIHLPIGKEGKVKELDRIPDAEIERLLLCEKNGTLYSAPIVELNQPTELSALYEVERVLSDLDAQVKAVEAKKADILAKLQTAMETAGVKKYESDKLAITYVDATTKESVDTARLKKEMPDIARQYAKTSTVKAYVKVKVKADEG